MQGAKRGRSRISEQTTPKDVVITRVLLALALALAVRLAVTLFSSNYVGTINTLTQLFAPNLPLLFPGLYDWLVHNLPDSIGLIIGALSGKRLAWVVTWIRVHGAIHPDRELLRSIHKPLPFDPLWGSGLGPGFDGDLTLPWIAPPAGTERFKTWNALNRQIKEGLSDGSHASWERPEDDNFIDFSWMVLVGLAGSGKTRMAVELLRDLAQCKKFEGIEALSRWEQKKILVGEWIRRVTPGFKRLPDDPWDIGWIEPPVSGERLYENRLEIQANYLEALRRWRPRRPTALLLDDPRSWDALHVLETLQSQHEYFIFPVRLLIVSQTLPTELFEEKGNAFRPKVSGFAGYFALGEMESFSEAEITELLDDLSSRNGFLRLDDKARKTLREITRGNHMLLELAVHAILGGAYVGDLNADRLVHDRAVRVFYSLKLANQWQPEDFRLLAGATIAGPKHMVRSTMRPGFRKRIDDLTEHLRRCFNLASTLQLRDRLPAVLPELVGDSFVRMVFVQYTHPSDADQREEVVADAWQLGPDGVFEAIKRAGARLDPLGQALRAYPPKTIPANPPESKTKEHLQLVIAYATAASHTHFGQLWPEDDGEAALQTACELIRKFQPEQARKALEPIANLACVDKSIIDLDLRAAPVGYCYLNSLNRFLSQSHLPKDCDFLSTLASQACEVVDAWERSDQSYSNEANVAVESLRKLVGRLERCTNIPSLSRAACHRMVAFSSALAGQLTICTNAVERVLAITDSLSHEREYAFEQLLSLESLCRAEACEKRLEECRSAAQRGELIAGHFCCDQPFVLHQVRALRHACNAYASIHYQVDPRDAVYMNYPVTGSVTSGPVRPGAEEFASAQAQKCLEVAVLLDDIADRFTKEKGVDYDLELERARVWRLTCYARSMLHRGDEGFGMTMRSNTQAGVPYVCYRCISLLKSPGNSYTIECAEAAAVVDQIADRCPLSENRAYLFQLERARAWRQVCAAQAVTGALRECLAIADLVDRIARPFGRRKQLELERIRARQDVCYAMVAADQTSEISDAAEAVDRIAEPFGKRKEFEIERLRTARHVCAAQANSAGRVIGRKKNFVDADSAREVTIEFRCSPHVAADRASEIAMAFRGLPHFEYELRFIQNCVLVAQGQRPGIIHEDPTDFPIQEV